MKKQDILMGELIGKQVEIIKSTSKEQMKKKGKIIDETLKTIIIETPEKKEITIPKKDSTFLIEGIEIQGKEILYRPEDRIKKYWRKFNGKT